MRRSHGEPPSSAATTSSSRGLRAASRAWRHGRTKRGRGQRARALTPSTFAPYSRGLAACTREENAMRIVDLSMTVEECDSAPFAKDEYYFKVRPIVRWEDKGFVSNMVEMTVHAGTHIDSPHHFFRDKPNVEQLPLEAMVGEAVVLDLTFKGAANARITPEDMERAEAALAAQGIRIEP